MNPPITRVSRRKTSPFTTDYDPVAHTKLCRVCRQWLPCGNFYPQPGGLGGVLAQCKRCQYASRKAKDTPDKRAKRLALTKAWSVKNRAYVAYKQTLTYNKMRPYWRKRNRERLTVAGLPLNEYHRQYRKKNIERTRANARRNSKDRLRINPEKVRAYRKLYRQKNAFEFSARCRVNNAIRRAGVEKSANTSQLIGTTREGLKRHLESLWALGMDWENYGPKGWHIDHKRPCASFDLTDPAQQRACFHYTNLQPMWATDNHSKGAKWSP